MIEDDDDLDDLLFDTPDETDAAFEPVNCLIVGCPAPKEILQRLEEQFRRDGGPPVLFVEDDDNGQPYLGNAAEMAKLMKLPGEILPTEAQADAWIARRKWLSLEW